VTADVNVAVVCITNEPAATAYQFLVEVIEYEIALEWRERAALRSSLVGRFGQPVSITPTLGRLG
jgi:hypothetical protein